MAGNLVELAVTHLVKRVEPLTRFDRSTLRIQSGHSRVVEGTASWLWTVTFSNERKWGTGRLPYATRVNSEAAVDEASNQALSAAHAVLPDRLRAWAAENDRKDHALEPSHCFPGPQVFGHEWACRDCGGLGRVPCHSCKGVGSFPCAKCGTKGRIQCPACRGFWRDTFGLDSKGKVPCRACKGTGKVGAAMCGTCNGKGAVTCPACGGTREIVCPDCKGPGQIQCKTCSGQKTLPCRPCEAKGFFYVMRTVSCAVGNRFRVGVTDSNREVVEELTKRDLRSLRALAHVTNTPPVINGHSIERVYGIRCAVTELTVNVTDQTIRIVGYGDSASIFNFKNVVKHLLAADLATLKREVGRTPWRLWQMPPGLVTATSQFLTSEVNFQIDDARHVRDGIVDGAYVTEAKALLRGALGRLFCTQAGAAFAATVLLPATIFLIGHFADFWQRLGEWMWAVLALAAVAPLLVLEQQARQSLSAAIDRSAGPLALGKKVDRLLSTYYITWTFRVLALLLAVVVLTGALYATSLPAFQRVRPNPYGLAIGDGRR